MGAGCYYTHNCNKERAAWIQFSVDEEDEDIVFAKDIVLEDIEYFLKNNKWNKIKTDQYQNGLFSLFFESTYYGDGLVIRIEPRYEYGNLYHLAMANHHITERKIWKLMIANGYELRIATSGYTSTKVVIE